MKNKPKLIINADDYGLSPKFNKGISELAKNNIVSSVSVMIDRKFIKIDDFKKFEDISIGLHLELKEKSSIKNIEAQLKKFRRKFGYLPSHLDGHKHCHLTDNNIYKVIKVAKKYNFPVRSRFPKDRKILKKYKIKTLDNFISWHSKRKNKLFSNLKNIKAKITELVCHPGYYDKNCDSSYNRQRELELKLLKSRRFKDLLKNFDLISYNEL